MDGLDLDIPWAASPRYARPRVPTVSWLTSGAAEQMRDRGKKRLMTSRNSTGSCPLTSQFTGTKTSTQKANVFSTVHIIVITTTRTVVLVLLK
jgi:hypothetical protein